MYLFFRRHAEGLWGSTDWLRIETVLATDPVTIDQVGALWNKAHQ